MREYNNLVIQLMQYFGNLVLWSDFTPQKLGDQFSTQNTRSKNSLNNL